MGQEDTPLVPSIEQFFSTHVAPRFASAVRDLEQSVEALRSEVEDLRGAKGTICWAVEGASPVYLNIADGVMGVGMGAAEEPLMTVRLAADHWRRLAAGSVRVGLFDGGGSKRRLGRHRMERLRGLRGAVRFVFTGMEGGDWVCAVAFGGEAASEPKATVSIASDAVARIQSGQLDPQAAFMMGLVRVSGDVAFVMQLGMAMFM